MANAGPNLALESETSGTLLGSGSDVDNDALTYLWTKEFGLNLNLSSTTSPQPTINAPRVTEARTTRMKLVVSDANSDSVDDTVDVVLYPVGGNIPPFVDPGESSTGTFTTQITLNGSGSFDLDGGVRHYSWTQTEGPLAQPPVPMSDPTSSIVMFKQYEPLQYDATYVFELYVSDGFDISAPDTVPIIIVGYHNNAVPVGPRESKIFNGNGSVPEVTQISGDPPAQMAFPGVSVPGEGRLRAEVLGSPALFGGPDGNNPHFHLSSHGSRWIAGGTQGFRQTDIEVAPVVANTFFDAAAGGAETLTVTGPQKLSYTFLDFLSGEAQSFEVNVWFRPVGLTPTADPGNYPNPIPSATVIQLDGTGSSDPDGIPLTYSWTQVAGPGGTLSNRNSPAPLFKLPTVTQESTIDLELEVNNGFQLSALATAQITVSPPPPYDRQFPVGVFSYGISGAQPGEIYTVTIHLPAGLHFTDYVKFGPTPENPTNHWYEFPLYMRLGAIVTNDVAVLYLADGFRGDNDLRQNGFISDPGGPAVSNRTPVAAWQLYK